MTVSNRFAAGNSPHVFATFVGGTTDAAFFVAPVPLRVVSATEIHSAAGTDAGAVTIDVTKATGTGAPGAGNSVLAGTFNAKGAANTIQSKGPTSVEADRTLAVGDRLTANFTGTVTALAGVVVTVALERI